MSETLRETLNGLKDGLRDEYVTYVSHVEFASGYISMTVVLRPKHIRIGEEQRLYEALSFHRSKFLCGTDWTTHWDDFSTAQQHPCG